MLDDVPARLGFAAPFILCRSSRCGAVTTGVKLSALMVSAKYSATNSLLIKRPHLAVPTSMLNSSTPHHSNLSLLGRQNHQCFRVLCLFVCFLLCSGKVVILEFYSLISGDCLASSEIVPRGGITQAWFRYFGNVPAEILLTATECFHESDCFFLCFVG